MSGEPFWQVKTLAQMSPPEWESLCDGCGQCCLVRFEDEDTGEIVTTHAACRLFDHQTCRCTDYADRQRHVPDCVKLTPGNVAELHWMPRTCAYRRLHEGLPLPDWHPLVSGRAESVREAKVSVWGSTFSEGWLATPESAVRFAASDRPQERQRRGAGRLDSSLG